MLGIRVLEGVADCIPDSVIGSSRASFHRIRRTRQPIVRTSRSPLDGVEGILGNPLSVLQLSLSLLNLSLQSVSFG